MDLQLVEVCGNCLIKCLTQEDVDEMATIRGVWLPCVRANMLFMASACKGLLDDWMLTTIHMLCATSLVSTYIFLSFQNEFAVVWGT